MWIDLELLRDARDWGVRGESGLGMSVEKCLGLGMSAVGMMSLVNWQIWKWLGLRIIGYEN